VKLILINQAKIRGELLSGHVFHDRSHVSQSFTTISTCLMIPSSPVAKSGGVAKVGQEHCVTIHPVKGAATLSIKIHHVQQTAENTRKVQNLLDDKIHKQLEFVCNLLMRSISHSDQSQENSHNRIDPSDFLDLIAFWNTQQVWQSPARRPDGSRMDSIMSLQRNMYN
jgi:hypothetical protein